MPSFGYPREGQTGEGTNVDDQDQWQEPIEPGKPQRTLGRRIIQGDSYVLVLLLLVITYLTTSLLPEGGIGGFVIVTTTVLTMLAALRTSLMRRGTMRVAATAGAAAILLTALTLLLEGDTMPRIVPLVVFVILLVTPFTIGRRLIRHRRVTYETLAGAVDVYLLIGLIFSAFYGLIQTLTDQPFFAQVADPSPNQFLYFSFVTLVTLGYGDLTPGTNLGRTVVVMEAILGQVFLITAVARAVSLLDVGRSPGSPR